MRGKPLPAELSWGEEFASEPVVTSLVLPIKVRNRLREKAYAQTRPDETPVSMGEVLRAIIYRALREEDFDAS